ncbi:putative metalloendopeptidase NDAI_0B03670 [Naumovozyma dairenensis CBS 421]|uniref:Jacalin-type lectin domain-containing protein n=1 Tax=Naumovozyma dairenensis (strain ATCC 10597 / BCRC 20456 / CBS 421 / NBRC 0211 / NRRL Y-12639) TaxID=1071378 RepID=G0W6J0_NAUDC|nr:hypothetical protein NDAI_0B03670 [Naumovozyma dairenensis CBS 421]CCD23401.1 hypothetical protein NDAI_0B03670 [Naumovozyma dairenensis CBS 421]
MEFFNLNHNEQVVSPCLTIHGKLTKKTSGAQSIQVQHPQLPPLTFPINEDFFKATVILTPGENKFTFITDKNVSQQITCYYTPLLQDQPIHLCLILAKDSPMKFDSPKDQIAKENGNDLYLAIKKLRMAGRLLQAFTNEQMLRNGFGHRTVQFVEEYTLDTEFQDNPMKKLKMRNNIKIHLVRSEKSIKEIRSHDIAQQNSKAKDAGALYGIAMDALKKYGGPFINCEKPVQAACIYMDTHWDGKLITGHAALGGGDDHIKLAIFGSHGIYSWPRSMEDVVPYFLNDTKASTTEVANDCGQCGSYWECLAITMGAFWHEMGHLLGSPHQEHGVMLRDYTVLNRSFLTKEAYCLRTKSYGAAAPIFPKEECTWHRLDLLRYLYHPSFTKPEDYNDPSFFRPSKIGGFQFSEPNFYPLGNDICRFSSQTGITVIEIICGDLALGYIEYLPVSLGGPGPQKEVVVSLSELRARIPANKLEEFKDKFTLNLIAVNSPSATYENFPSLATVTPIPMGKYGYPESIRGFKSPAHGQIGRGKETGILGINVKNVVAVRVYHGAALDGMRFFFNAPTKKNEPPAIPSRTYVDKLTKSFKANVSISNDHPSVLFGVETPNYSDVILEPGEYITGFTVKSGWWIDAVQVSTNYGRKTDMLGNKEGGGQRELFPPEGQYVLGIYGSVGNWVDSLGIVYGSL